MPGRKFSADNSYRYGFNGKEKDDEVRGEGSALDFGNRSIYDSRLARFVSADPLSKSYPYLSPYAYAANNPILFVDKDGEGPKFPTTPTNQYGEKQVYEKFIPGQYKTWARGGGGRVAIFPDRWESVTPAGKPVTENLSDKQIYRLVVLRNFFPGEFKIDDNQYLDKKYFEYEENAMWYFSHNPNHNGASKLQPETVKAIKDYFTQVLTALFSDNEEDGNEAVRLINNGSSGFLNRLSWVTTASSLVPWGAFSKFSTVTTGLSADARFAQTWFSENFGTEGRFAGQTVNDVAGMLKNGTIQASSIPIMYIVRDGKEIILNTRSAAALTKAGIPRANWSVMNMTGDAFFEELLSGQLKRNKLTNAGTTTTAQGEKNGTTVISSDKVIDNK